MIELHVEPGVSKSWEDFLAQAPPGSIALDGYVIGPPALSEAGPHANFDHHAGVDRLATRSTCMQVFMAITLGLFDLFSKGIHLFVNDPDQDTCLAVWLLRNRESVRDVHIDMPITRLILAEDILDCTGGAYPAHLERRLMREQAWVFDPYIQARYDGRLFGMDADGMRALIGEVCERIGTHAAGKGKMLDPDDSRQEIGGGPGWRMIVEDGAYARTALFAAGVRAFVAVRENGDGTWTYSLGRMSPFVPFPVEKLYAALNVAEGLPDGPQGWGGSNIIGGSPRKTGSKLPPSELERVINENLAIRPLR